MQEKLSITDEEWKQEAKVFLQAFIQAWNGKDVTTYIHVFVDHLGYWLEREGLVEKFSNFGIKTTHTDLKRMMTQSTQGFAGINSGDCSLPQQLLERQALCAEAAAASPVVAKVQGHRYFGRELCKAAILELFPKQKHERAEVPLLQQQLEAFVALESGEVRKHYNVSHESLRRWAEAGDGRLRFTRTPGGNRLYHLDDIQRIFNQKGEQTKTEHLCYARVSSSHQRADLARQVDDLRAQYPSYEIIQDVGSGLNYKRRGFQSLLERVYSGMVSAVVVTHKDRLCRYGFELLDFLFRKTGTRLVVLGDQDAPEDGTRELADDLLAICNYFVAKNNGRHSALHRRQRSKTRRTGGGEEEEEEEGGGGGGGGTDNDDDDDEAQGVQSEEDTTLPHEPTEGGIGQVCLAGVKDGSVKRTMTALRKRYLNQKDVPDLPLWVLETPFDVRDEGMRDLVKAYASNLAKHRKQKKRLKFEVQFCSKKDPQESIIIHSKHWVGPGRFYPSILKKCLKKEIADREEWKRKQKLLDDFRGRQCGLELLLKWRKGRRKRCAHWIPLQTQRQKGRTPKKKRGKTSKRERRGRVADAKPTGLEDELTLRGAEPLPEVLPSDSRLIRTRWGKYYLAIPMPLEGSNNQAPSSSRVPKVVAIDPGVRTFGTCYVAPEGKAYEWGRNDIGRIYRICHYLDDLQSRWGQPGVKARQRYRM
ncbi:IS200/IS605 family element transposase accessory protein TnpB [Balamuthia mandrillaris]